MYRVDGSEGMLDSRIKQIEQMLDTLGVPDGSNRDVPVTYMPYDEDECLFTEKLNCLRPDGLDYNFWLFHRLNLALIAPNGIFIYFKSLLESAIHELKQPECELRFPLNSEMKLSFLGLPSDDNPRKNVFNAIIFSELNADQMKIFKLWSDIVNDLEL